MPSPGRRGGPLDQQCNYQASLHPWILPDSARSRGSFQQLSYFYSPEEIEPQRHKEHKEDLKSLCLCVFVVSGCHIILPGHFCKSDDEFGFAFCICNPVIWVLL